MDCVIPGHSVRPFCASIGCLSRIGKDLYVEFDPIDGLAFRTLNDAKSAYACFRYEASFFERCTAPPVDSAAAAASSSSSSRKRSAPTDNEPLLLSPEEEEEEMRFSCRITLRALAAVVRPRKDVVALRVRSEMSSSSQAAAAAAGLYLSFEFQLLLRNDNNNNGNDDSLLTVVVHRMKVADATGVSAVAPTEGASEIVTLPRVLLRLLEPLKKTTEAALIVRSGSQTLSASSFHHTDTTMMMMSTNNHNGGTNNNNNNNAILQATSAALLKSETAVGCDEFEEFDFRQDRNVENSNDKEKEQDLPENVNREVILVFPIKEAKSFLQFCSQAHLDQELRTTLFFHWGGKPLVMQTSTESFSAHLVLATLDHKLLTSLRTRDANGTTEGALN